MGIQEAIKDMEERFVEVGAHEHPDKNYARSRAIIASPMYHPGGEFRPTITAIAMELTDNCDRYLWMSHSLMSHFCSSSI